MITAPTAPQNLAASTSGVEITLSWQVPASDGGSAITGYRIYRGNPSGSETFLASTGVVLSYTDTTVSKDVTYYYQVSAVNSVGEGPKSNESSFRINSLPQNRGDSSKIKVYPNPYIKGKSSSEKITFSNLPKEATINIYTVDGELIETIEHRDTTADGKEKWDVSDINSGVYLYVISLPEGVQKGKISLIR